MRKENVKTGHLLHLSKIADFQISDQPWVKFQSAGWVNIQSAPTPKENPVAKQSASDSSVSASNTDESFRLFMDSVVDYAIVMLDPGGHVVSWNNGAERIKGYRPEEILGKDFSCFYPADAVQLGLPEQELKLAAKDGRFEDEGWRVRKGGNKFWASVVITALRDKEGTLRGFGKVTRDLTERKATEEQLRAQSREIMELSTPVMQVWQGVVVAPLIGSLDSQRTQQFMERLLNRIVETNSSMALVDIMGVPTIDTQTAQHLIETISAVRLLGAQVVMTGVRPAIAQTLVHLGIDLSSITTRASLAAGLRVALDMLNLQVVAKNG
jgi:PAS domain S-box-containing protein